MTEEENIITPGIVQPETPAPQMSNSGLIDMLKNPYVLAMLKKNPDEVNSLLDSFGATSKMMAMTYLSAAQPELYAILKGEKPDSGDVEESEDEERGEYQDIPEEEEPQKMRSVLDLTDQEFDDMVVFAYDKAIRRGLNDTDLCELVKREHGIIITPFKMKEVLKYYEKHLPPPEEPEEQEEEIPQPAKPNPRDNTAIIQKLLNEKRSLQNEVNELKKKPEIVSLPIAQPKEKIEKKGLVRRFISWLY